MLGVYLQTGNNRGDHYHFDNDIFTALMFFEYYYSKYQSQSFPGVGYQHQNDRADQAIQTMVHMSRTLMVHTSLHWTEYGFDDLQLLSFAVHNGFWLYNSMTNRQTGIFPMEMVTSTKYGHRDLKTSTCMGLSSSCF